MSAPPDLLGAIMAAAKRRVADQRDRVSRWQRSNVPRQRVRHRRVLRKGAVDMTDRVNVIAECKRRSPSRGVLRWNYDPVGDCGRLREGRRRGHFRVDRARVLRRIARSLSAAAAAPSRVPCCARTSSSTSIRSSKHAPPEHPPCCSSSRRWTMDELRRLFDATRPEPVWTRWWKCTTKWNCREPSAIGATIVGVNNRNLRTLAVDVEAAQRLAPLMPGGLVRVAESGLRTGADVRALSAVGYRRIPDWRAVHDRRRPGRRARLA